MCIRDSSYSVHLDISIGGMSIERFSGDGILVATSAGSTAYNYSLGGSIVDPRLKLLQVTPIAPMNTTAYRSFTSSILLPSDLSLGVIPEHNDDMIFIVNDGTETEYSNVKKIDVMISETYVPVSYTHLMESPSFKTKSTAKPSIVISPLSSGA